MLSPHGSVLLLPLPTSDEVFPTLRLPFQLKAVFPSLPAQTARASSFAHYSQGSFQLELLAFFRILSYHEPAYLGCI